MDNILHINHIDTLDEFHHADPDDYASMYRTLGTLCGSTDEYRIAELVDLDLIAKGWS
jgi:hypothetical protein